jgi:hypothetical protein
MTQLTPAILKYYQEMPFEQWVSYLNNHQNDKQLGRLLKMAISDYTDYENMIKNAKEPTVLSAGTEVKARIVSVRSGTSDKNSCDWFMPTFDVPNDPMVQEFNDFFWELDREKLDAKQFERGLYKFQQFMQCFDIDISRPFDKEDEWPGKEGWVIVGVRKSDEYGDQNSVKKYVTGPKK